MNEIARFAEMKKGQLSTEVGGDGYSVVVGFPCWSLLLKRALRFPLILFRLPQTPRAKNPIAVRKCITSVLRPSRHTPSPFLTTPLRTLLTLLLIG
jgi:hypothetical protein